MAKKKTKRPSVQYGWADGSQFSKYDAQKIGEYLNGNTWTPESVVADAKGNKRSPLRKVILYANKDQVFEEALLYRARRLLKSIVTVRVRLVGGKPKSSVKRVFLSVSETEDVADRGYTPIGKVLSDRHMRKRAIRSALIHCQGVMRPYKGLDECYAAIHGIEVSLRNVRK